MPDAVDLGDDAEDLLHDDGREAERGLVEHEEARPRHERAADGEHLLLAAGHGAGGLAPRARRGAGRAPKHARRGSRARCARAAAT